MFDIKRIFDSWDIDSVSKQILKFGFLLSAILILAAIHLTFKSGYDFDRLMLRNYLAETSGNIFFMTIAGSILFDYLRLKKKNAE